MDELYKKVYPAPREVPGVSTRMSEAPASKGYKLDVAAVKPWGWVKKLLARLAVNLIMLALPALALAQVTSPPQVPGTVPVPYNPAFGFFGPAGQVTASGLIIGLIEIALAIVGLISVLFVIIGGFRYVTAGGNEEQVEAAKKTLLNAIIGVVIVILAFVIVRVIANALIFGGVGGT